MQKLIIMTWKELSDKISKMTEEQQGMAVQVWGEEKPLEEGVLCFADEDMLYNEEWDDCCYPRSMVEEEDIPEAIIVATKGTPYIFA